MFVPCYHDMKCFLTVLVLYVQISRGFSQQCENKDLTILAKTQTPLPDFKPIFTADHITFGVSFQNCLQHCDTNEHCIGFEVCQVNENLYRCRGCCEWRKRKTYGTPTGFSMCTFYGKNIDFGNNLAINKPATLSTQWNSFTVSSNAVDGITICPTIDLIAATVSSTVNWLSIQLESTYNIRMVVFYARTDRNAYEAAHIHVIVSGENFNHPCGGEYPGPTKENDVIEFLCPTGTVGSKVTLHKQRPQAEHLTLCEVEVFGNLYP